MDQEIIGLIGDLHGNYRWAIHALDQFKAKGIDTIIQLGDFGFWPGHSGLTYARTIQQALESREQTLYVVPGNHEDWHSLDEVWKELPGQIWNYADKENLKVLPRGYRFELNGRSFYAFGGAPSIDFEHRTAGVDWWPRELPSEDEYKRLLEEVAETEPVDVFLAHDVPELPEPALARPVRHILNTNEMGWSQKALKYAQEGRVLLTPMYSALKPKMWIHGHYHVAGTHDDGNTFWVALGTDGEDDNLAMLDTQTLEVHPL